MIVIIAPEPVPWLLPLVRAVVADGPVSLRAERAETSRSLRSVTVFAPWAHANAAPRWLPKASWITRHALPKVAQALRRGFERRLLATPASVRLVSLPGFIAIESLVRAWERDDVGKRMSARFMLRHAVDTLAARWLPRDARTVYAPSCGAERVFAAARARGQSTALICDMPSMRRLHADLDRAALRHPECVFLQRFRAPAAIVARQESELVLGERLLVRGAYAREVLLERGISEARIAPLATTSADAHDGIPAPAAHRVRRYAPDRRRVLLAGLASARNGSNEALGALERDPTLTLLVHAGEGTEPRDLLAHPNVIRATKEERAKLIDVDAVLAPAWCESYPPEIVRARALGIPVVATRQARGFTPVTREIAPGTVPTLTDRREWDVSVRSARRAQRTVE